MAAVHVMKLSIYLPFVQSLKEKRKIRSSLIDRYKKMNISAIEMADQDLQNHLVLLLSYCALSGSSLEDKKIKILDLAYEASEHIKLEEETIDLV